MTALGEFTRPALTRPLERNKKQNKRSAAYGSLRTADVFPVVAYPEVQ